MIIGLDNPEKLGNIIEGTYYRTPTEYINNVRVYIIRESNFSEWKEYRKQMGINFNFPGQGKCYYYEVSID